jgi:SUMO ligase MMS21 Smc5/6 complex component
MFISFHFVLGNSQGAEEKKTREKLATDTEIWKTEACITADLMNVKTLNPKWVKH